ncbi:MAG: hypothetical protein OXU20_22760 [Myxococcales bacterium]|nr:hypothetical protein [Myxococcales bacterium]
MTAATVLVSIAPERVSAAVTDSVLYWRDATKTLYSSSVEILGSYQTSGYKFVTAKTQIINDSSGTRDAECTLSYGGSVDRSRVKLSSKRRATIFLEVMGSDNSGNAYLLCRVVSSSTSGVKTAWSKMNVMSINKGWAYQQ